MIANIDVGTVGNKHNTDEIHVQHSVSVLLLLMQQALNFKVCVLAEYS